MTPETEALFHVIGLGVQHMRDETRGKVDSIEKIVAKLRTDSDEVDARLVASNKKLLEYLNRYDRITLALYELIVDLSKKSRSTKRTRAERLALASVVDELIKIRPLNDSERADVFPGAAS